MRFALIATTAAAAVAVPLAMAAAGPQMSSDQFLSAVRCTAYEDISRSDADLAQAKWQLNSEVRRQAPETAAQAYAQVDAIARQAVNTQDPADQAMLVAEGAAACQGAQLAAGADWLPTA